MYLDFSLDMEGATFDASAQQFRQLLGQGLQVASNRIGIRYAVHSVQPEYPKPHWTFITYKANVGCVLPDEQTLLVRMANNPNRYSPHVLPVEIRLNEPICDSTLVTIDPAYPPIRVSTLEDIIGEKPRASPAADSRAQPPTGPARYRRHRQWKDRSGSGPVSRIPAGQGGRAWGAGYKGCVQEP